MIFIGIDSGTQSTKAIALNSETGKSWFAQETYDLIEGLPNGHMEQHPQDWIDATKKVIARCVSDLGELSKKIKGIGVSGQQHGLVVLDEFDQVIRPRNYGVILRLLINVINLLKSLVALQDC